MREIKLTITDEEDAAALVHNVTIEKVIDDRRADLVNSAAGVVKQQTEAAVATLPTASQDTLTALKKQQDAAYQAAVAAEVAKLPPK